MNIGLIACLWPTCNPDSGIANNYHRLACSLASRGHAVTVFHLNPHQGFWQRARHYQEQGFEVVELPARVMPDENWKGWLPAFHAVALIRLYFKLWTRGQHLDVIETTSFGGFAWLYYKLIWRGSPPFLVRISTTGEQTLAFHQTKHAGGYSVRLEDLLVRYAPNRCTHTEAHRAILCAALGIDPAAIDVIPHGIDLPDMSSPKIVDKREVLYVGRFETRKGTDVLLEAIPLVLAEAPDCTFNLVGGGTMAKTWRESFQQKNPGLEKRVRFLGRLPLEELEELFQTCDFLVSPSLYESFGMTNLEAMRYGKPVIGFLESGGSAEVVGEGGVLVPSGDAPALAQAIIRLWKDRALRQDLSVRARQRAEYYSMERKAERTEQAYGRLIGQGGKKG